MANTSAGADQTAAPAHWYLTPTLFYLLVAVPIVVWVSWAAFEFPMAAMLPHTDFWEHSAVIREWKRDLWHPGNPHLDLDVGSPRYMPFYFILTVIAKLFSLDPIQTLAVGASINMVLLAVGVRLFFASYFRNLWAPLVGFIVLLGGWGVGWLFSNLFQLRDLFFCAAYPSMFVFSLSFFGLWMAVEALRRDAVSITWYAVLALLMGIMLVSHPLTGVVAAGTIGLMALLEPGTSLGQRFSLLVAVVLGAALTELWPYFSTWDLVLGTSGGEDRSWIERGEIVPAARPSILVHPFYKPWEVAMTLGPAFLGIPALIILAFKRRHLFIVAGFLSMMGLYLLNLIFPIPLGWRFLLFAVVFLQLALSWWILESAPAWRAVFVTRKSRLLDERLVLISGGVLAMMALWNVALAGIQFAGYQILPSGIYERYTFLQPVHSDLRTIAEKLPDDALVIGRSDITWPLPTFQGKTVSLWHVNPMVPDLSRRSWDVKRFHDIETPQSTRRQILARYNANHILYKKSLAPNIRENLNALGEVITTHKNYVLLKVNASEDGTTQARAASQPIIPERQKSNP